MTIQTPDPWQMIEDRPTVPQGTVFLDEETTRQYLAKRKRRPGRYGWLVADLRQVAPGCSLRYYRDTQKECRALASAAGRYAREVGWYDEVPDGYLVHETHVDQTESGYAVTITRMRTAYKSHYKGPHTKNKK